MIWLAILRCLNLVLSKSIQCTCLLIPFLSVASHIMSGAILSPLPGLEDSTLILNLLLSSTRLSFLGVGTFARLPFIY